MYKFHILFLLLISFSVVRSQNVIFYGKAEPGGLMIGKGNEIKSVTLNKKKIAVDKNGLFVFGFDRDAKGTHLLKVRFKNKKPLTKRFVLPKRKYEIQRLKLESKYVLPPQEELDKIEKEFEELKSARAKVGKIDSAFYSVGFVMPVDSVDISGLFGSQRILNGVRKKPHNGIDFSADEEMPIYAISDGVVIIAGEDFYFNGNFVLLAHGQGLTSIYLHMSELDVGTGDIVKRGQKIGEVGSTGRSTAAHLHLGVQWNKKRIDPLSVLEMKFP